MDYEFSVDGTLHKISIERSEGKFVVTLNGNRLELDAERVSSQAISLLVGGKSYLAHVARQGEKIWVAIGTHQFCLEEREQEGSLARVKESLPEQAEETVKAPMPGLVIKVNVSEGNDVNPGDGLVVVEAMKMEHEMRASFKAIVEKIHVKAGQQVDAFQPLVELKRVHE
jgi:propionyl-CoA carboxylase alpha chain